MTRSQLITRVYFALSGFSIIVQVTHALFYESKAMTPSYGAEFHAGPTLLDIGGIYRELYISHAKVMHQTKSKNEQKTGTIL